MNGITTAKVHVYQKELPKFIKIQHSQNKDDKDILIINHYDQLPHNFVILVKTQCTPNTRAAIKELEYLLSQHEVLQHDRFNIVDFNKMLYVTH